MGSPASEKRRGKWETLHEVVLTHGVWLGVYPVTQEQWQAVIGNNPSRFCAEGTGKDWVKKLDTRQFPVENVSWEDALEFCSRLAQLEGGKNETYRLPTEAQWEYACRAGTRTPFHFGASLNGTEANCDGTRPYGASTRGKDLQRTCAVGAYVGNAFGLFDMHGNVWEWCADWFADDAYQQENRTDPVGPFVGVTRVVRGGSWNGDAGVCRSAHRYGHYPDYRYVNLGFRLACRAVNK
jgi:formylglycine-generating enzyme required for sulfatase activity